MGKHHHAWASKLQSALCIRTTLRKMPAIHRGGLMTLTLGISACVATPTGISGRWTGTVKPISGTCDPASQAILDIRGGAKPPYTATFSPTGGVLALQGESDGVSHVYADLHKTGMNHRSYIMAFSGTKQGDVIVGTYVTQLCRSEVLLRR